MADNDKDEAKRFYSSFLNQKSKTARYLTIEVFGLQVLNTAASRYFDVSPISPVPGSSYAPSQYGLEDVGT